MALDQHEVRALDAAGFDFSAVETARSLGFYAAAVDVAVRNSAKDKLADLHREVSVLPVTEATRAKLHTFLAIVAAEMTEMAEQVKKARQSHLGESLHHAEPARI